MCASVHVETTCIEEPQASSLPHPTNLPARMVGSQRSRNFPKVRAIREIWGENKIIQGKKVLYSTRRATPLRHIKISFKIQCRKKNSKILKFNGIKYPHLYFKREGGRKHPKRAKLKSKRICKWYLEKMVLVCYGRATKNTL